MLPGLADVVDRLAGVELVLATDDDTPLLGLQGTSAVEAPRKGASPEQAQALEGALGHFTDVLGRALPSPPSSCSAGCRAGSTARRAPVPPGVSATALLALGARRVGGVAEVLRECGFGVAAARSDLVVTGAGRVDWSTLRGSVVAGVAAATLETGRPTVLIAGECLVGRRETMTLGLAGTYAVADSRAEVEAMVADPVATLAARTARVARTWSPRAADRPVRGTRPPPRWADGECGRVAVGSATYPVAEPGNTGGPHGLTTATGPIVRPPPARGVHSMSDQLQTTEAPTTEARRPRPPRTVSSSPTSPPARCSPCSRRRAATTCACGSACSPAAAPA